MKYSDILAQHIYSVDFGSGYPCEFDRRHLAVVIKKNPDQKTMIVAPLTTSNNGVGSSKQLLGKISNLPPNLKVNDAYLVYNQVRTINVNRFYALKNNGQIHTTKLSDELFEIVLKYCSKELVKTFSYEHKINFYSLLAKETICEQIIDLAYQIRKDSNPVTIEEKEIKIRQVFESNLPFENVLSDFNRTSKILDDIENIIEQKEKSQ